MTSLGFCRIPDIDEGVKRFRESSGAVLLDVRTRLEYAMGHIPDSINVPLQRIEDAEDEFARDAILFVYCQSGMRSREAARMLTEMGFDNVCDIGGVENYTGKLEI